LKFRKTDEDEKDIEKDDRVRIGFKDLIAMIIAQFMILLPIAVAAIVVFYLVLLFFSKVWLRA
jgi:hypothetical protein